MKLVDLNYMDPTESKRGPRRIDYIVKLLGVRFDRTESERACSWMTRFAERMRANKENYKDPRARFSRCVHRLRDLNMPVGDKVIFHRSPHALRRAEGQLHIALRPIETRNEATRVDAFREIGSRMCEKHRNGLTDSPDVFNA